LKHNIATVRLDTAIESIKLRLGNLYIGVQDKAGAVKYMNGALDKSSKDESKR
jgi:hypothetical protein